jgi:hypothetical protein
MELMEIRVDPRNGAGERLNAFFAAHLAYEQATAWRMRLVHATALSGVPVFLCASLFLQGVIRASILGAFAASVCATGVAWLHEIRCLRALSRAEQRVCIRHSRAGTG